MNVYQVMVHYGAQSSLIRVVAYTDEQAIHKAMGMAPYAKDAYVYHRGELSVAA